jgi:clan AA aspartic protease (TIGR02281 family)
MKRGDNRAGLLLIVLLLVCIGAFAYYFVPSGQIPGSTSYVEKGTKDKSKDTELRPRAYNRNWPAVRADRQKSTAKTAKESSKELKIPKDVITGWVTIVDPWGGKINKFRAGLTGDGWLALPASDCLGGNTWYFESDSGLEAGISGGLWVKGDKVGLWRIVNAPGSFGGPVLAPWDEKEPVSWKSIESASEYHSIKLYPGLTDGFFISTPLQDNIDETGVFIQNGRIVGWSFSKLPGKGFMWPGNVEQPLEFRTWVKYFYNITFANGREEKFARALSIKQGDIVLARLALFIEGFKLRPKLLLKDTPDHLLPEEIIKRMRVIVINAMHRDEGSKVVHMFSSHILKQIGDIGLFIDLVPVIAAVQGFEAAIIAIEDTGAYIVQQLGREVPALNRLHRHFYQDWLKSVLSDGEADGGSQIYTEAKYFYPDDPDIHLSGVELKLLSGDWEGAERLLYMRNYPPAFQTRFQLLASRISEMKGEEEKIVIRFPLGSNRIMVTAAVNGSVYQDFVVDTGATVVTIPSSTAGELGLNVVYGEHMISTVGGPVKAGEVIIDTIEIDGWVEYDVRAFVVDIPGRPRLGLLGLNYLSRFQMDLKPEEGTLMLSPR